MEELRQNNEVSTYPLRTITRLTGLSPELLRAWERRYNAIQPLRTAGGTRRYTNQDLERLKLLKAVVDSGLRIGQVAQLDLPTLRKHLAKPSLSSENQIEEILTALERLDGPEAQRLLSSQLSALGPTRFAKEFAFSLIQEIGDRWASDRFAIPSEHLATSLLRSMLGSALQLTAVSKIGPKIIFGTPTGERHELGLQIAALTALGAGANPIYLGTELPIEDLVTSIETSGAVALALSLVTIPTSQSYSLIGALRGGIPDSVKIWIGGAGTRELPFVENVTIIGSLEDLEQRVFLLEK